jgi:hypothetical protein
MRADWRVPSRIRRKQITIYKIIERSRVELDMFWWFILRVRLGWRRLTKRLTRIHKTAHHSTLTDTRNKVAVKWRFLTFLSYPFDSPWQFIGFYSDKVTQGNSFQKRRDWDRLYLAYRNLKERTRKSTSLMWLHKNGICSLASANYKRMGIHPVPLFGVGGNISRSTRSLTTTCLHASSHCTFCNLPSFLCSNKRLETGNMLQVDASWQRYCCWCYSVTTGSHISLLR